MSEKIVQLNEAVIKSELKELVRGSVEETLNELLEAEAQKLTQAARYERNEQRQGYRSGHYSRNLTTTSGDVTLKVPKLKGLSFETAIIERYRRRESSVEEALIEMYLAGVSVRRVEDITEALWGSKVSPSTISELNKKAYVHIEDWRNRPLQGERYPYVYVDGIYLRRNWGGEFENVAILVAIAVNEDGYREVLGAAEGMKEDKASWVSFFQWLRSRGLDGVKLVVGDKCLGMLEAVGEVFPEAKYQRCTVHFYRNVFSVTPRSKVKLAAEMLKVIHARESKKSAREKAKAVVEQLRSMKLKEAAKKVEDGIEETLTYYDFPGEHWTRIRTNNVIERLNREIRRRTRVVGSFRTTTPPSCWSVPGCAMWPAPSGATRSICLLFIFSYSPTMKVRICRTLPQKKKNAIETMRFHSALLPVLLCAYSFSTSVISLAVAVTIRMPLSLMPSSSASSCRRLVDFSESLFGKKN